MRSQVAPEGPVMRIQRVLEGSLYTMHLHNMCTEPAIGLEKNGWRRGSPQIRKEPEAMSNELPAAPNRDVDSMAAFRHGSMAGGSMKNPGPTLTIGRYRSYCLLTRFRHAVFRPFSTFPR